MIPYGRQSIDRRDREEVLKVLESDYLTTGPKVGEFERALAEKVGAPEGVAVSSGTAALHLAALALLKPGDKVITTPNSFVATANAILYGGGVPLFVDIGPDGNMDLQQVWDLCEREEIRGLFAVHFSGRPLDREFLARLKERFGLVIVEDGCHALGADYGDGGRVGECRASDATIFSFHPVKQITTGEGGAITTRDRKLAERLRRLRNHGIEREQFIHRERGYDSRGRRKLWYYEMVELGYNYRLSDLHAALGLSQLSKLDSFLQRRRELAVRYDRAFQGTQIVPLYPFDPHSAYHLYVVRVDFSRSRIDRSELFYRARERGIALQLHYIPIPWHPYYEKLLGRVELPSMELYYREAFSIPLYPDLTEGEQEYIVTTLLELL
ncbi:MAG: UDP-4-amino-4,6-dideoxy-N-acetyl-beta-L-altrosamine transaminase [Epsilonproteobacteria bacterium]|nr:UDP-4-amino-4,6-dideoxy-N-acetyl-beta-L-altrosamine transaminase [Campylobacterota bacterium]NPA56880.1 UDP-4-amino-4,6-dideoxy-N-acetyl-beta-L-altrosamine transaminase [Campylobacterota bacterium]